MEFPMWIRCGFIWDDESVKEGGGGGEGSLLCIGPRFKPRGRIKKSHNKHRYKMKSSEIHPLLPFGHVGLRVDAVCRRTPGPVIFPHCPQPPVFFFNPRYFTSFCPSEFRPTAVPELRAVSEAPAVISGGAEPTGQWGNGPRPRRANPIGILTRPWG